MRNINTLVDTHGNKYTFAEAIGVSYDAVRQWCIGENLPDGARMLAIRDKFGVSIDWLLTGADPAPVSAYEYRESVSPYESGPPCPFCGDMSDEIKKLCITLKDIIDSKHPVIVPALLSNLEAFKYSVDKERKQDDDIDKLKREVRHLKTLMSSETHSGSGKAAGAGMRKTKT
jgi:transcriptional regulator with XRE-family HTH domain